MFRRMSALVHKGVEPLSLHRTHQPEHIGSHHGLGDLYPCPVLLAGHVHVPVGVSRCVTFFTTGEHATAKMHTLPRVNACIVRLQSPEWHPCLFPDVDLLRLHKRGGSNHHCMSLLQSPLLTLLLPRVDVALCALSGLCHNLVPVVSQVQ